MGRYFGTDGFRGEAGIDLTADHAYKVGRFLGWYYNALRERNGNNEPARIVIGKDTRRSSYMFEYSLVAGLTASGADAYATSFDSIALTASCYSYHTLEDGEQPNKGIQLMWCILLILLPIALLFAESSMNNLQSVSIVAAFPIGAVIVMIAVSFMKDAKKYMESLEDKE